MSRGEGDNAEGEGEVHDGVEAEEEDHNVLRMEAVVVGNMDLEGILQEVRDDVGDVHRGYEVHGVSNELHSEVHSEVHERRPLIEPLESIKCPEKNNNIKLVNENIQMHTI